jgi:hypothetical protein
MFKQPEAVAGIAKGQSLPQKRFQLQREENLGAVPNFHGCLGAVPNFGRYLVPDIPFNYFIPSTIRQSDCPCLLHDMFHDIFVY